MPVGSVLRSLDKLGKDVLIGRNSNFLRNALDYIGRASGRTATRHWKPFIDFHREVQGKVVMKGKDKLVDDVLPGKRKLDEMVQYKDLPELKPQYAEIAGVKWSKSERLCQSGSLIFPESFSGLVPMQFATRELLSYYGVTIAGESVNKQISIVRALVVTRPSFRDQ